MDLYEEIENIMKDTKLLDSIQEHKNESIIDYLKKFHYKCLLRHFSDAFQRFYNLRVPYDRKRIVYDVIRYSFFSSERIEINNLIPIVAREKKLLKKNSSLINKIDLLKIYSPPRDELDKDFNLVEKFYKLEKKRRQEFSKRLFLIAKEIKQIALSCEKTINKEYEFMDKYYEDKINFKDDIISEARDLWLIESKESKKYDNFTNFLNIKKEEAGKKFEREMKNNSEFIKSITKLSKFLKEENIEISINNLLDDQERYKLTKLVKELVSILK